MEIFIIFILILGYVIINIKHDVNRLQNRVNNLQKGIESLCVDFTFVLGKLDSLGIHLDSCKNKKYKRKD